MEKERVLVIDDEKDIRNLLCISLERMGYAPVPAGTCAEALTLIKGGRFDMALTDVRLPDGNGMDLIPVFKKSNPEAAIAVMTAYDTTDIAVDAMKRGAFDFLPKPIRHQRLKALIDDALDASSPETMKSFDDDPIIGESEPIQALRRIITKVAQTQAPVLISGESGTGKELAARSIHQQSHRKDKPFIAVNCGAIPSELMESEFFGHLKGSFTGASSNKDGLFQAAEGGTLFLDEVADLPLSMQVKLLRAIQEKAIRPVGAQEEIMVNVRILSATHRNLNEEVSSGNFRQDLYYRLNVIHIETPALRDRVSDLKKIAIHILARIGNKKLELDNSVLEKLSGYSFPGNVRELENILHRADALCDGNQISVADIQLPFDQDQSSSNSSIDALGIDDLEAYLASIERSIIESVLEANNWNRSEAAKQLGLTQRQFRYKLAKYGLSSQN